MRIGITCYPTYGGSGVVATELGIELAARGHEVHFISYAPPIRLTGRKLERCIRMTSPFGAHSARNFESGWRK